jgi:cysteine-rich repeat protein
MRKTTYALDVSTRAVDRENSGGQGVRHDRLSQLCLLLALAFLLPACLLGSSFDADGVMVLGDDALADSEADGALPDIGATDGSSDSTDADLDTGADIRLDTGADVERPDYNLCGGLGELLVDGESVRPGSDCGPFGDGVLVCNGREALRCLFATDANACGGPGDLPAELGSACGCAGVIVCADDGGVDCAATVQPNSCGGCDALEGRPGFLCEREGTEGRFVCETFESLVCASGAGNACGGDEPLRLIVAGQGDDEEGEVLNGVFPGDACTTVCGAGRYTCSGVNGLLCQPDRPCNACGGTRSLAGAPDSICGACGQGRWQCSGVDSVGCMGAVTPNVCGGCDPLSVAPGDFCVVASGVGGAEVDGVTLCRDGGVACSAVANGAAGDAGAPELNDCGGTSTLRVPAGLPDAGDRAAPGDDCGACARGELVCAGADALLCTVSEALQSNVCNGCTTIIGRPDAPCGTCGTGRLTCAGSDTLACSGDLGEEFGRNACGGCGSLPGAVSAGCGSCLVWACTGIRLECTPTTEGAGCDGLAVCAGLDCAEQNRECEETDGVVDARCGGCVAGSIRDEIADDDSCRPYFTCEDIACDEQNLGCEAGTETTDAECAAPSCGDGFVQEGEECDDGNDRTCDGCIACSLRTVGNIVPASVRSIGGTWNPERGDFTMEGWVRIAGSGTLMGIGDPATDSAWAVLVVTPGNELSFGMAVDTDVVNITRPGDIVDGQWHHVAAVRFDEQDMLLFVDGRLVAIGEGEIEFGSLAGSGALFVGGIGSDFLGATASVDDVRFSDIARYKRGFTPETTFLSDGNTVALYTFNDSVPGTVVDSSGNGRTLTYPAMTTSGQDCLGAETSFACGDGQVAPWEACDGGGSCNGSCLTTCALGSVRGPFAQCYTRLNTEDDWTAQQARCQDAGLDLVTIESALENVWLDRVEVLSGDFWIGLNDRSSEGNFVWTSGAVTSFYNWLDRQPDGQDCVKFADSGGGWSDENCQSVPLLRALCE